MTQQPVTLDQLRERRRVARRQRPYSNRRSQLERHLADILALREEGASLGDIQYFLRTVASPRVTVERSTIKRFLDKQNGG